MMAYYAFHADVLWDYILYLRKRPDTSWTRQTEKTRILIFYDLNKKEEKAKYMICM